MWILSILPDWVFHVMLAAGVAGTVAGFVLGMIPFIKTYIIPIRIISLLVLSIALYLEGGIANNLIWQARVKEVEAKLATAEAKSQEQNVVIVEKIVVKTKKIRGKSKTITEYIDREVVKNQDVIKYIEMCPAIPDPILKAINDAAKMRTEVKK
jgi:uncharacterized membrane protein